MSVSFAPGVADHAAPPRAARPAPPAAAPFDPTEFATDWGDEVMQGVFMIRRAAPHTAVAQLRDASQLNPADLTRVHEEIEAAELLMERLEATNAELREFIDAEREARRERRRLRGGASGDDGCGMDALRAEGQEPLASSSDDSDGDSDDAAEDEGGEEADDVRDEDAAVSDDGSAGDGELEDAILENAALLKSKASELQRLRAIVSSQSCGCSKRHRPAPGSDTAPVAAAEAGPAEAPTRMAL